MTIPDNETPPEASLVEPLLPPESEQAKEQEAAVVSLILEEDDDESSPLAEPPVQHHQELLFVSIDDSGWEHGELQEVKCQNSFFALLFLLQVFTVIGFAVLGIKDISSSDTTQTHHHHQGSIGDDLYARKTLWFFLCLIVSIVILSATVLTLLLRQTGATKKMIRASLVLSPLTFAVFAIFTLVSGTWPLAFMFVVMAMIGACYATSVWHRVPVAAANLAISMTAIQDHKRGLVGLAYFMTFLTVCWTVCWGLAVTQISTMDSDQIWDCQSSTTNEKNDDCSMTTTGTWIFIGLLLSIYWTTQVIKNLFHTTVAGVVGTWWFTTSQQERDEEAAEQDVHVPLINEPKRVVYDSWIRASVYSLGSICFGSLVVAVLQVLQYLVRAGRQQRRRDGRHHSSASGLVWCLLQCLVDQLERLAEYINKWAFVYIGLYGYDYWTAGSKVYQLFRARGWSVIINDQLVTRCLMLVQLLVALLSGAVGVAWGWLFFLEKQHHQDYDVTDNYLLHVFFWAGFILGILLSDVLFRLVFSAVDTIVVCFAEAPNQLLTLASDEGKLSPELANEMIASWRRVYPNECGF